MNGKRQREPISDTMLLMSITIGIFVVMYALAMIILQTPQLLYYMAVLMLVGLACGALTGVVASSVMKHLKTMR